MTHDQKIKTLDPQDWDEFRKIGHQAIDDMVDFLSSLRDQPAWTSTKEVTSLFNQSLPQKPTELQEIYKDYIEKIRPHHCGNIHPRFWGWVMGNGTPSGVLAELLTAVMNSNSWGGQQGTVLVEEQVLLWLKELFGFPKEAGGLLVSGCSMANLIGLSCAREAQKAKQPSTSQEKWTAYCSTKTHNSIHKGMRLLGFAEDRLRLIETNSEGEIDLHALRKQMDKDIQDGDHPFCVIGTIGTVGFGAIDPIEDLIDLCSEKKVWLHIDGAFGAFATLTPHMENLWGALQRVDSLAFDLHKWFHVIYDAGCILVRNPEIQKKAFTEPTSYLASLPGGPSSGQTWFSDLGPELSRTSRALKIWFLLREQGIERLKQMVEKNIKQAQYLKSLIEKESSLELLTPTPLNIVCFRYVVSQYTQEELNIFNQNLLIHIQESGVAVPSQLWVDDQFAIRVSIVNHRTQNKDLDLFINTLLQEAKVLKPASPS